MKTYEVTVANGVVYVVQARGFSVNEEGQLIFKNKPNAAIVAMFATGKWENFVVVKAEDVPSE